MYIFSKNEATKSQLSYSKHLEYMRVEMNCKSKSSLIAVVGLNNHVENESTQKRFK